MSLQAEFLWVMGIFVIAFLVWLNAATTVQRTREADEKLDKIIQLLANPGTTLEDIKRVISGIDDSFANSTLPLRVEADLDKEPPK